jgi:hypothetical protein
VRSRFELGAIALVSLMSASAVSANETISYVYDARGRLIKVVHSGTVNNNVQACYKYDKADNRVVVTTTTAGPPPACPN